MELVNGHLYIYNNGVYVGAGMIAAMIIWVALALRWMREDSKPSRGSTPTGTSQTRASQTSAAPRTLARAATKLGVEPAMLASWIAEGKVTIQDAPKHGRSA